MISIFDMAYSVIIKDTENIISQNALYNMQDDFMHKKNNLQKMPLAGFSQRGSLKY